jgi:uncharacterized protein
MAANYLHGVETVELRKGPRPIRVVKTAVIGLVGIGPIGLKNQPILVSSALDAAQFGEDLPGFTIPKALNAILSQGAGQVIVVNVFDPTADTATVSNEAKTVENGKFKLAFAPIGALTSVIEDVLEDPITYVLGQDYTVDAFGVVTAVAGGQLTEGTAVKVTYKRLDASQINAAQVIGSIDSETEARTGLKCFDLTFNLFGFNAKIFIAPGYSTLDTVATELIAVANKFRAIALIDAPEGTTRAEAIAGRGPLGDINFNTSSNRAYLLYPHLKAYDAATDAVINAPYSQYMAGVIAATDIEFGYWFSPSNKEIKGIVGVERQLSAAINDPSTDVNLLNEAGITTVFNSFGSGLRTWGNRSAAYPSSTFPDNFISVRRVADVLHESVELASLQFIDEPINQALIDAIRDSVNAFIRTLIQRGALIDGECTYDPAKNEPTQIAAGHLVFDLTFMPPTPAERITFESFIDINLLSNLA